MTNFVSSSIVDLKARPVHLSPHDYSHNPLRESQLLFGERVEIIDKWRDHLKVKALEQSQHNLPYEGWVEKDGLQTIKVDLPANVVVSKLQTTLKIKHENLLLSYGTTLHAQFHQSWWEVILPNGNRGVCEKEDLRPLQFSSKHLIHEARRFLGTPYLWGGRGAYQCSTVKAVGVDCSGLISLLFRAQGKEIPRNAHDQFLKATKLKYPDLNPGTLVFLRPENKGNTITHVLLCLGNDTLIEAPESGKHVRLLKWKIGCGQEGELFFIKDRPHLYHATFGTYL
ncbi:MAG: C40 family peptidase [Chlamydiia bacterium]|nr:C40 family peptidase [Chlamydiia bacterium]